MAVPKRKTSKARTRRRHAVNRKLSLPKLVESKESGELIRPHHLDASTGMYNGRHIVEE